jgi:hypothetical protein
MNTPAEFKGMLMVTEWDDWFTDYIVSSHKRSCFTRKIHSLWKKSRRSHQPGDSCPSAGPHVSISRSKVNLLWGLSASRPQSGWKHSGSNKSWSVSVNKWSSWHWSCFIHWTLPPLDSVCILISWNISPGHPETLGEILRGFPVGSVSALNLAFTF